MISRTLIRFRHRLQSAGIALVTVAAATPGCQTFDVNLATDEPIKIDVDMQVDLYQHGAANAEAKKDAAGYRAVVERKRNRMAEIQELKNNRLVGENHMGMLSIRDLPAGEYGEYVNATVEAENVDRSFLMTRDANRKGVEISVVQEQHWKQWQQNSFPGEWIEVDGDAGDTYRWVKKEGVLTPKKG